jgi:hypothetical protein
MEKFLSIPVTNEQNQLVSCTDIKLIEQSTNISVVITYGGGKVTTIAHAALGVGSEEMRDAIQNAVIAALQTAWSQPAYTVSGLPVAVTSIAIA